MAKYAHRLPKFEDVDGPSTSKRRADAKPYDRPATSTARELQSLQYQLNKLGGQYATLVKNNCAIEPEGRDACGKVVRCLQRALSFASEARDHVVEDPQRKFEQEWAKREKCLKEQCDIIVEERVRAVTARLESEKEQLRADYEEQLRSQRQQHREELEETVKDVRACIICRDEEKNATLLRCGHTFCEGCCLYMIGDRKCAVCRTETGGYINVHLTD
jgi:hypothetical protein